MKEYNITFVEECTSQVKIKAETLEKAKEIVSRAATHMALEKQSIGYDKNLEEIEKLTEALVQLHPSDLWD